MSKEDGVWRVHDNRVVGIDVAVSSANEGRKFKYAFEDLESVGKD